MTPTATLPAPESAAANAVAETLSLVLGAGFTLALFLGVAHFAATEAPPEDDDFADLRAMAVPLEVPPPRPVETPPVEMAATPFAGLEISATESPVRIAVVPPDLATLLPTTTTAPAAKIEPAQLYTEFKPRTEIGGDFSRIFQQHEVDQRPSVLSRPKPYVPPVVRGNATSLKITVLMVISEKGAVTSLRVLEGSGNEHFDAIMQRYMRETWVFTPAVKNGRRVRCIVQQTTRIVWEAGSPFGS